MTKYAISIKNLKKIYKLYNSPLDRLKEMIFRKPLHNKFVSLENINIDLKKGETLGIIGENGAGKSTLLKIIARTLMPTEGTLEIKGRVSSLLELGSGFHPEFSGIDNIYFYGSLIGINKTEMQQKIDAIVEFSELKDFINYPIKTYSSGMFVRLAFSVITAIDPDILIVDEALSVGDLHFQKKSVDKILSFKEQGKTILFCSHSMYHIARLCDRAIWLKNGKINMQGEPFDIIQEYESYQLEKNKEHIAPEQDKQESKPNSQKETPVILIKSIDLIPNHNISPGDDLQITIQTLSSNDNVPYRVAVILKTPNGLDITGIGTNNLQPLHGSKKISLLFPSIPLRAGTFNIEAYTFDAEGVHIFDMKQGPTLKIQRDSIYLGILQLKHEWSVQ